VNQLLAARIKGIIFVIIYLRQKAFSPKQLHKFNKLMETLIKLLIVEDYPLDAELIKEEIKRNDIAFSDLVVESKTEYINALIDFFFN
jgi:hypothetical protein